jgi:hypothetical protein
MSPTETYRPYRLWRDPTIWVVIVAFVVGVLIVGGIAHFAERRAASRVTPAPWGAAVPTDCKALREQARAFTQGTVNAGRPFGGSPVDRALVALAELQLWQAEGCRP